MNPIIEVPLVPKLTPTLAEFTYLLSYLYDNETLIAPYGGCKIIPPREWTKPKQISLSNVNHTPSISRQSIIKLSPLISRITNSHRKSKSEREATQLKDFVDFAQRPQNRVPYEVTDVEGKFWTMINSNDIAKRIILYATNIDYSLFPLSEKTFNLNDIPIKSMLSLTTQRIKGVTSPFLHVGMFGSMFALHTEQSDLFSMNYMHEGSSKFWYIVPPSYADRLEQCLEAVDILDISQCQTPLRHKTLFPNPTELMRLYNIPVFRIEQCPNEIVVTLPRAYHWGFNGGLNIAESVNFALPSWILFGRNARLCTCQRQDHPLEINMDPFSKENVDNYTQTHLNSLLLQLDYMLMMPSDKQTILDLAQTSPSILPAATFTDLSFDEANAFSSDNLSIFLSTSVAQNRSVSTYSDDNIQLSPSLLTSPTTSLTNEQSFNYQSSLGSNSTIIGDDEVAAQTALIRHKWIEEKDTLLSRLISDVMKPEIGSIDQWKTLINSDDVNLDGFLPENIQNSFHQEKRKIESFADWTVAFTSFRKAVIYIFNHRRSELDAHFEHISKLARASYSIKRVLVYEADVRCHIAKMPHLSLFADFAFLRSKHFMTAQSIITDEAIPEQKQICLNYNSPFKRCRLKKCPRLHICSICFDSMKVQMRHSAVSCRTSWRNHRQESFSRFAFSTDQLPITPRRRVPSYYPY